jgi:cell division protein FtsN
MVTALLIMTCLLMLFLILSTISHAYQNKKPWNHKQEVQTSNWPKLIKDEYMFIIGTLICIMFLVYVGLFRDVHSVRIKDENGFTTQQRKLLGIPDTKPPTIKSIPSKNLTEEQLLDMQRDLDKLMQADQDK